MEEVLEIGAGIVLPLVFQGIKYLLSDNTDEGVSNTKNFHRN